MMILLRPIPWIAIGDFNVILCPNEKLWGNSSGRRCPQFGDFVNMAELQDLGFKGPAFTWHRGGLFEKLDRVLGNVNWVRKFLNCLVTYLPKIKSDYRTLLLSVNPKSNLPREMPF